MALHWNVTRCKGHKEWKEDMWKLRDCLVWQTIAIHMNCITEANIEEFVRRCNIIPLYLTITTHDDGTKTNEPKRFTVEEVKPFIGLSTNMGTKSAKQWARLQASKFIEALAEGTFEDVEKAVSKFMPV